MDTGPASGHKSQKISLYHIPLCSFLYLPFRKNVYCFMYILPFTLQAVDKRLFFS